jgi:DnaA family protein
MQQLLLALSSPPAPTLENFAVGGNAQALHALQGWLRRSLPERCIYLWGAPGSGKTHLLRALVQAGHERNLASVYLRPDALASLEDSGELPRLIAVDDAERLNPAQQASLFRLFERATEVDTLLLAAAAVAPAGLPVREDLRTRLAFGLTFQLHLLSDEDKREALCAHAAGLGFVLSAEIVQHLLRHRQRDLPSLVQVLDALDRYSLQTQRPITLALLREMLQAENSSGVHQP